MSKHAPQMLAQELGLLNLTFPNRVDPVFAENEGLVAGNVLQAVEVGPELLLIVYIDVETVEIQIDRIEELSRGKIDVGCQALGRLLFDRVQQFTDETRDALPSVEANDIHRDFVTHTHGENGGTKGCHGKSAEDLYVHVPVGTLIYDEPVEEALPPEDIDPEQDPEPERKVLARQVAERILSRLRKSETATEAATGDQATRPERATVREE